MVEPIPDADRRRTLRRAKVALVVLIGASAGLVTTQGDASPMVVVGAVGGGVLLGAALVWLLFPDLRDISPASARRDRLDGARHRGGGSGRGERGERDDRGGRGPPGHRGGRGPPGHRGGRDPPGSRSDRGAPGSRGAPDGGGRRDGQGRHDHERDRFREGRGAPRDRNGRGGGDRRQGGHPGRHRGKS